MNSETINHHAVNVLQQGGVIIYPCDTIYGLGCDILSESAVDKIYALKQRDRSKPLLLLVSSVEMLKKYIRNIHPRVETLLAHHVRPLTIIYKANENIPSYLLAENKTIGIRIVQHDLCKSIIEDLNRPITSTSANLSGMPFPTGFEDLDEELTSQVDLVIPQTSKSQSTNQPSIVAKFNKKGELKILRN